MVAASMPSSAAISAECATRRGAATGVGSTRDHSAPWTWRTRGPCSGSPGRSRTKQVVEAEVHRRGWAAAPRRQIPRRQCPASRRPSPSSASEQPPLLFRGQRDQRRPHRRPRRVAGEVRDGGLERGDHREPLERRRAPGRARPAARRRPAAASHAPAARSRRGSTLAVALMQPAPPPRSVASRKVSLPANTAKPRGAEPLEQRARVVPVAGAVLDARDDARVPVEQALDQREADGNLRHRGYVVEVDAQPRIADALDHLGVAREQAVVRHALVVERRQHQHAAAAVVDRAARQLDGVGQRAGAGPGHHPRRRECPPRPARRAASSFSDTPSEFASELVPKTARPTSLSSSQRQWRASRAASGRRSAVKGVTTGERHAAVLAAGCSRRSPAGAAVRA